MNSKDKISKASWNQLEGIRDVLLKNITAAVHGGQIKIDSVAVTQLLSLMNASLDEGYHRGIGVFERVVMTALDEAAGQQPQKHVKKK